MKPKFGLVYLDGEHEGSVVSREIELVKPMMHKDGIIVIDDIKIINDHDHPDMRKYVDVGRSIDEKLFLNVSSI